jgi:hypothetical protein
MPLQGVVPDTFKDSPGEEAEVVLKGQLSQAGFAVDANGIMAKCPSKYEAEKNPDRSARWPHLARSCCSPPSSFAPISAVISVGWRAAAVAPAD